jgi:hypothetical protein
VCTENGRNIATITVKQGSFVGVTGMPQADGSQCTIEVHIFPEAMRGTSGRALCVADPVITTRIESTGQIVAIRGPRKFALQIKELRAKLAATAKALGIKSAH